MHGVDTDRTTLLDREHLALQTFGDADLARELLDLFAGQCERLLPGILDRTRPASERADLAHTLKGSALGIGARRVADISGAVEDGLRGGAVDPDAEETLARAVAATLGVLSSES